jgi:hypothetical protein
VTDRQTHRHAALLYVDYLFIYSANIKPPRHRFGFSLAWGWQYTKFRMLLFMPKGIITLALIEAALFRLKG